MVRHCSATVDALMQLEHTMHLLSGGSDAEAGFGSAAMWPNRAAQLSLR
ncbi:hypothetical protein XCR_1439 [Xanthomonas campestris pv. raphani 756C]|nr:hypothetical protein XCR_1439 [Xanthomonas campestris pv. raphani 756C]